MPHSSSFATVVIVVVASTALSSRAHAIYAIETAGYGGGLYGTEAVTTPVPPISGPISEGGQGILSSSVSQGTGTLASSADLSSGVLTAYSAGGAASASEWDTFTFSGLPAGGATITASLSISGLISGNATGLEDISAGPSGSTFGETGTVSQSTPFITAGVASGSISVQFTATDASSITVFSQIIANGSPGNIADLGDPPTLTLGLPTGVTATPASGVFDNFETVSAVPEPATAGLLLAGLAALAGLRPLGRRV
jgi:hypothetical protein